MINLYVNHYQSDYVPDLKNEIISPSDSIWLNIGLRGLDYENITLEELKKQI